ncbi:alpha/beta fold hydrolase [Marilutibacter chinensis]|uniref:AB hydrolase-1 domain-containing protein n=1 Tax=Marilutibacter chinensis TaxID=2912247 RepID=A0ABS9HR26_9GAMM|nr:alpha/beta fold hydrolase [Lysobacter chinensis]MCF7220946.1 hypothetical protein [Lysobacter chinensis]
MDEILRFGPHSRLSGVLTGTRSDGAPILVLPSAGLIPRAGPFRLHVELAHRLARHGIRTFRYESPGVGETPRLKGCGPREAALEAIGTLHRETGQTRFVVGGVCSAADAAWMAAQDDTRVGGLVMIDGISFIGPWFHLARARDVLRRGPQAWPGIAARLVRRLPPGGRAGGDSSMYREWPSQAVARRQFTGLVERGVRSLWIFTGGYTDRFLHPRQFYWGLGAGTRDPRVSMRYWPDCDHTFYARSHRERLLDTMEAWLTGIAWSADTTPVDSRPSAVEEAAA